METPLQSHRSAVHPFILTLGVISLSLILGVFTTSFALIADLQLKDSYGVLYKPFQPLDVLTLAMAVSCVPFLAFLGYGILRGVQALERIAYALERPKK